MRKIGKKYGNVLRRFKTCLFSILVANQIKISNNFRKTIVDDYLYIRIQIVFVYANQDQKPGIYDFNIVNTYSWGKKKGIAF